jgi:N-acyl homoserine lactone hydrolase
MRVSRSMVLVLSALGAGVSQVRGQAVAPSPAAQVTLTRLDCGNAAAPSEVARFSDTYAFPDLKVLLTYSCYLIRHGDDYMLWDAGNAVGSPLVRTTIVDQLKTLSLTPAQIRFLGISHYHGDHTGQASAFPQSTLLIGKGDWEVLSAPTPAQGINTAPFAPWLTGGAKVEPQAGDKKDVFGDGTVVMLSTPGHTPGHHSLLVRLRSAGAFLITGDLSHFRENYDDDGVPTFNVNRADSKASIDRFKRIAQNLRATVIIQHDARDIPKLPAFPAAAR